MKKQIETKFKKGEIVEVTIERTFTVHPDGTHDFNKPSISIMPGRIQECYEDGVKIEDQFFSFAEIKPADSEQNESVLNEEKQVADMTQTGYDLMNTLVEPEFI